jgi:hypothetical protein
MKPNKILETSVKVAVKFGLLMFLCMNFIKLASDFSVFPARADLIVPLRISSCITPMVTWGVLMRTLCFNENILLW